MNIQQTTSVPDLSAKLLREFFKVHPMGRVRHLIKHFRVIPTVSTNPMTGSIDVSFQPDVDGTVLLEDVLTLIEKAHSEKDRMIVVLDEFQEIRDIAPKLDKQMRSIMQEQKHINYVLLGSQESMMTGFILTGMRLRIRSLGNGCWRGWSRWSLQPFNPIASV